MNNEEKRRLCEHVADRNKQMLWIDERSNLTAEEVARTTRQMMQRRGVKFIVVDYLQRMNHGKKNDTYTRQVGETAKALKTLARDCAIPVICLAQLNRQSTQRADGRPALSDLRDSGEIEQEADVVLLLHPEPLVEGSKTQQVNVLIEKQRNGPCADVALEYIRPLTQFQDTVSMM